MMIRIVIIVLIVISVLYGIMGLVGRDSCFPAILLAVIAFYLAARQNRLERDKREKEMIEAMRGREK